ncbi:MAG: MBL fold metallo-hydrolase [Halobacteria archaeon]|nr:MBL fold metallo-hydrolase [Halobacteria archaeon]
MDVKFLGGAREVGRSAVLVDDVLVDYGLKTGNPPEYPLGGSLKPDTVVLSHGHLDHVGAVPTLMNHLPDVHQTPPTRDLNRLLAEDTLKIAEGSYGLPFSREDVLRLSQTSYLHPFGGVFQAGDFECEFYDAGHIPGSASVLMTSDDDTTLFYTGDINTVPTQLLTPAPDPPHADAMIIESTYFNYDHPDREELEEEFVQSVRNTLYQGGDVIIPVFAIGRTQEILMILEKYDVPCYVDGMGTDVTHIFRQYPEYIRDSDALKRAWNHAKQVDPQRRDRVLGSGSAVVTTSGMLTGGPAVYYVKRIRDDPVHKICLTGYQIEGTPGREALESKRAELDDKVVPISAQVELYDFSAHAGSTGLREYVEKAVNSGVEHVLCVHGDEEDCVDFAEWVRDELNVEAMAPKLGEEISI